MTVSEEDKDILDDIEIKLADRPLYIGPQTTPPSPGVWMYTFRITLGAWKWDAQIEVSEEIPEIDRKDTAVRNFKKIFSLISKKVSEF